MILIVPLALIAAALLLAGARLRAPLLAGAGLAVLGLALAVPVFALHGVARALIAVPGAAVLLGAGELGFGLADGVGAQAPGDRRAQARWVGACAAGAAATAFVVLGSEAIGFRRSATATVAGAALAAILVWLLVSAISGLVAPD